MYVEASYPRAKGDVTKLRSPTFPMSGYSCKMEIAYHMRGYHIGTLAIEVQAKGGKEVVFNRTGEQPDGWQRANITIGALNDFNITIWGIVGDGYAGDIAIDDVSMMDCSPPYWEYVYIKTPPVSGFTRAY